MAIATGLPKTIGVVPAVTVNSAPASKIEA